MTTLRTGLAAGIALATTISCARQVQMDEHMAHMSAADMAAPNATPGWAQGNPSLPASGANAAARLASSPRHGEWIRTAYEPGSADSIMAWLVYPVTSDPRTPVVVVIHENTGLTTWVRGVADQVAADGFIAIAPDLLSRARGGPSTQELSRDSVGRIIQAVTPAERTRGIIAVANYAMSLPSAAPRYAVIGYCWGGGTTWFHAVHGGTKGFAGGVSFYGAAPAASGVPIADSLAKISVPFMLLNGSRDARIGAMMPAIDSIMKASRKDYVGINYPDAIHGFLRAQGDTAARRDTVAERGNVAATADAWPRTIAFLKKNLGVK